MPQRDTAARRRQQRRIARELKADRYQSRVPKAAITIGKRTVHAYLQDMLNRPDLVRQTRNTSPEGKKLARAASLAMHGKADPRYYDAFKDKFYHKDNEPSEPDENDEQDYRGQDEDEDEELC